MVKQEAGINSTLSSALILAIANMGDAFLYAYLPANYQQIGISSLWTGVILSVNRFTRLFLNGRLAWFLNGNGIKTGIVIATLLSAITTISYGWITAIPLWILSRMLWGMSFSILRLGNTLYALEHPRKGIAMGVSRALIELGPVTALLTGPYLLQFAERSNTFLVFGLTSLAGTVLALPLHNLKTETISKKELVLSFPSTFNLLVLINAFVTEGVLVVLLVKLIPDTVSATHAPMAIAGLLLGYRRLSFVFLSPLSGWFADKWGFQKVFIYTTMLSAAGLLLMLLGATVTGIIVTFTFSAMNASIATGGAINTKYSMIKNVSDSATWRDIGTATGALSGALLLPVYNSQIVVFALFLLYSTGIFYHRLLKSK